MNCGSPWQRKSDPERKNILMKRKRIMAIAALTLIGGLCLSTLILAFIDSPFARSCLMASLFGTIVIPTAVYGYLLLMNHFKGRPEDDRSDREESGEGLLTQHNDHQKQTGSG